MIFAGLPLAQVLAVLGAAALGATVLYLLKLRRRQTLVPFSPLWARILQEKDATSLFSRLKRLLSLLLQIALLALLAFALGDPRAKGALSKERNLVVLVDASASMQATDVAPTRLDAAKEEVRRVVRGLGGADRMLVAQMDARVVPLAPMTGDTAALERALAELRPTDVRADFARGLRFAVDALRGLPNPEIVVVSDGGLAEPLDGSGKVALEGAKLTYVPVGKGSRNVAITQFAVRRYPLDKSRYEVMLEVTNTSPEAETVELRLFGDGALVDLVKLKLAPGERLPRFYPNLTGASRTLEARLVPVDGSVDVLPVDDHAYAMLPERRRAKVLVVGSGNTYLEAALLLDEYLDVTASTPEEYVRARAGGAGFDVVVFDGVSPGAPPKAHALFLDPRTAEGVPVKVDAELAAPGFDTLDRKHPLLRHLALDEVNVAKGHKLVPGPGDKVVGASQAGPLLVAGVRDGKRFVALGFDVRASDLPLRVAWPVFLMNVLEHFSDDEARYLSSHRAGEVVRLPVAAGARRALLKGPNGLASSVPVHEGRAVLEVDRAGFYALETEDGAPPVAFAANLADEGESRVAPAPELAVFETRAGALEGFQVGVRRELWLYLLAAVVVLAFVEWATYHRRMTV